MYHNSLTNCSTNIVQNIVHLINYCMKKAIPICHETHIDFEVARKSFKDLTRTSVNQEDFLLNLLSLWNYRLYEVGLMDFFDAQKFHMEKRRKEKEGNGI